MFIHHTGYYWYARGLQLVYNNEIQLYVVVVAGMMRCYFGADNFGADREWVVQFSCHTSSERMDIMIVSNQIQVGVKV